MNLSEEDKDMIVNEISLVIQNIISFFFHIQSFLIKRKYRLKEKGKIIDEPKETPVKGFNLQH